MTDAYSAVHSSFGRQLLLLFAFSFIVLPVGCSSNSDTQTANNSSKKTPQTAESTTDDIKPTKANDITLQSTDAAGFQEILDQQKGKVVLVDFWATWCVPCVKDFHHSVEWNQEFADQGLTVISVSMDESDAKAQVLKFLKSKNAALINLLATATNDQDPMDTFDIDGGALPHYRIYDRDGKLVNKFSFADPDKRFTQEELKAAIEKSLQTKEN